MTDQEFQKELQTLQKFVTYHCQKKHSDMKQKNFIFESHSMKLQTTLCEECSTLLHYAIDKLENCPHEQKPKCRKCPNPCYEKKQWKSLAKIMRYSSLQLGFSKIKKKLFRQ